MDAAAAQAVILAGGQGTRLRPLTWSRPKPVVPILNVPFLAYQLSLLRTHGVTDVILSCSYRVDDVREALGDGGAFGTKLRYVVEAEPLGTGGGVRNAADLTHGTIFVLNGDVGRARRSILPACPTRARTGSWRPSRTDVCGASVRSRRRTKRSRPTPSTPAST
ncbi:MAG: hypothetical protein DMD81_21650 [Candidatus Rokuibacteriota bacterium]|nr:MAG: hypothetical protein DMD81_21650 [Candidatus Rokubacteria bacterium]